MIQITIVVSSVPPTSAGARERAGLTDAPLRGIPAKWITVGVSGIANAACPGARFVTVRMTSRKFACVHEPILRGPQLPPRSIATPTDAGRCGRAAGRVAARAERSGSDGDALRIRGKVDGHAAVRAIDARRVEGLEDQVRLTPGAIDEDHARRVTLACDT